MRNNFVREVTLCMAVLPAGVPANFGRPLIDFAIELPPPAALATPAGGYGGPGAKQPQSIKQALEASDQMFAAKEREGNKVSLVFSMLACRIHHAVHRYCELYACQCPALNACHIFTTMYHRNSVHVLCILGVLKHNLADTFET